jgi:hypothetical protein
MTADVQEKGCLFLLTTKKTVRCGVLPHLSPAMPMRADRYYDILMSRKEIVYGNTCATAA